MTKRSIIAILVAFAIVSGLSIGYYALSTLEGQSIVPTQPDDGDGEDGGFEYEVNYTRLDEFVLNLQSGGPPPDGIPPIEKPDYWTVEEADSYLQNQDVVFGFLHNGEELAFPQRILVWHEIVNLDFDGAPISLTYCPLTGSCLAFNGTLGSNETTFGTSGKLVNSNLVMYDRETDSKWPQILSQAINKDYRGYKLERLQTIWTTWLRWKTEYPNSKVLSTNTGFARNYERDPYGSYLDLGSYYYTGGPLFPVMHEDNRLSHKTVVYGLDFNNTQHAVERSLLHREHVVNVNMGNESVVMFYDEDLAVGRAYSAHINGMKLNFSFIDEQIVDDQTGNVWTIHGMSLMGQLKPIVSFNVMWFAWYSFFPNTGLSATTY